MPVQISDVEDLVQASHICDSQSVVVRSPASAQMHGLGGHSDNEQDCSDREGDNRASIGFGIALRYGNVALARTDVFSDCHFYH